jgi:putative addiction module killer protein
MSRLRFTLRANFGAGEVVGGYVHGPLVSETPNLDKSIIVIYILHMIEIRQTVIFAKWLRGLRDMQGRARIQMRLDRIERGLFGDVKPVGEGVSELRIDFGPGYRIYFAQAGQVTVILLCGGDKGTQTRDIVAAKKLAAEWKE